VGGDVGSGHFYRCYAIAEKLIEKKFKIIFIVNNKKEIELHLKNKKIFYHVLKNEKEFKEISKNITKIIIDLPFKNSKYSKMLEKNQNTVIIDDLGNKKIFSDLLFNGSIVNQFQKYLIDKNITKYFKGPKFILIRSEFSSNREKFYLNKKIKKILIIFGGNDQNNITKKILKYFLDKKYNITIVIGPSYKYLKSIEKIIMKNKKIKLFQNKKNIAELYIKQDIIISSAGITAYELASLGIPSIFMPMDKYQMKTAKQMELNGFGINYGYWNNNYEKLDQTICLISNYNIRKKMSICGKKLVDGKGLERILKKIEEL
tara:strand:+ start:74 stop:1024 length:951 start_codon:yes stop_codon:yes gene_type:complete